MHAMLTSTINYFVIGAIIHDLVINYLATSLVNNL